MKVDLDKLALILESRGFGDAERIIAAMTNSAAEWLSESEPDQIAFAANLGRTVSTCHDQPDVVLMPNGNETPGVTEELAEAFKAAGINVEVREFPPVNVFEVADPATLVTLIKEFGGHPRFNVKRLIGEPGNDLWRVAIPYQTLAAIPDDPTQRAAARELICRDQSEEGIAAAGVRGALMRGRINEHTAAVLWGRKPFPMWFETLAAWVAWRFDGSTSERVTCFPKDIETIKDAIWEWSVTPPLTAHNELAANFKPFADQWGALEVHAARPSDPPLRESAAELAAAIYESLPPQAKEGFNVDDAASEIVKWAAVPREETEAKARGFEGGSVEDGKGH